MGVGAVMGEAGDDKMQLLDKYPERTKITRNLHNIASFPFVKGGYISIRRNKAMH